MKKSNNLLAENMRRFGTKNLNETNLEDLENKLGFDLGANRDPKTGNPVPQDADQNNDGYPDSTEVMTPRNLKVGSIYHHENINSSGENVSADYEYIGTVGNYDFKFRIVKSYMDEKTKNHYKKLGMEHWYKVGHEFTYTVQALQHYINKGVWVEKHM